MQVLPPPRMPCPRDADLCLLNTMDRFDSDARCYAVVLQQAESTVLNTVNVRVRCPWTARPALGHVPGLTRTAACQRVPTDGSEARTFVVACSTHVVGSGLRCHHWGRDATGLTSDTQNVSPESSNLSVPTKRGWGCHLVDRSVRYC